MSKEQRGETVKIERQGTQDGDKPLKSGVNQDSQESNEGKITGR